MLASRHQSSARLIALLLLILVTANQAAVAQGKYNKVLAIGDVAPGWERLPGVDGEMHSFSDLQDEEVIVVCFTSNTCLYSIDYEDRLIALQTKYAGTDTVRLVAINSNAVKADDLEHMKARAGEKEFSFAYLRDDDQSVANAWGATYTPEFFVLNADRRIVYMGAMDDNTTAEKVEQKFVEIAVDAVLTDRKIETQETPARGCTIRRPRRRKPEPDPISDKNASQ